jgi:hypothetical protein
MIYIYKKKTQNIFLIKIHYTQQITSTHLDPICQPSLVMFFFLLFITADGKKKLLQGWGIGGVATGEFFF